MHQNERRKEALSLVSLHMRLRAPQIHALEKLHEVISPLSNPIAQSSTTEINNAFRAKFPNWRYGAPTDPTELTVNLATGVGKTKLIGAMIAYLFNATDSKNFLIITPRAEISRKFKRELRPEHPKYIFGDAAVSAGAQVITLDNLNQQTLQVSQREVPTVWVLSPQSFSAKGARVKTGGDIGLPPVEILRSLSDLVVFFDESHHLGKEIANRGTWKREIVALQPRLLIGTTASAVGHSNILYSYPLKTCLKEKLYTKQVQIIAERLNGEMSDDEKDHVAIRYALERRNTKELAIREFATNEGKTRCPTPLLLLCCKDIQHAEDVYEWTKDYLRNDDAVRIVHSELNPEKYLPWLLALESEDNPVRVIVQVSMLNEGWDVSNVYTICPLRQMNSITMVEQVMGRGLRLPFGAPTGVQILDELDVVCFGNQTVQELANAAITAGYGEGAIQVTTTTKAATHKPSVEFLLQHRELPELPRKLELPVVRRKVSELDLALVNMPKIAHSQPRSFEISDPQTILDLAGRPAFPAQEFLSITTSITIQRCKFLSESKQRSSVSSLIERLLQQSGLMEESIDLSPEAVAAHVKANLENLNTSLKPEYVATSDIRDLSLEGVKTLVPEGYKILAEATIGSKTAWDNAEARRMPIRGWKRCVHEAVPFDVFHELSIARCIDRCSEVGWWFRNLPGILSLDTPAGRYSPDFAIFITTSTKNILLEVKGDIFAQGTNSEAIVKKNASELWCETVSSVSKTPWEYWFLLDRDASQCTAWSDIVARATS
jgi:superfamily II DNA or RNA helicase